MSRPESCGSEEACKFVGTEIDYRIHVVLRQCIVNFTGHTLVSYVDSTAAGRHSALRTPQGRFSKYACRQTKGHVGATPRCCHLHASSVSLEIVVQIHFLQTKMCHVQIEEPQVVVRSDCRSEFSANPYLQCMHSFLKHYQNSHCNTSKTPPSSAD
jgi:hypothetical protein